MSNPDWPGPYWQDDASAGRRGKPDDESAWDDTGFWRSGDGRAPQVDGWQAARGADQGRGSRRAAGPGRDDRRNGNGHAAERPRRAVAGTRGAEGNGAGRFPHTADELKNRLGIRGSALGRGGPGAVSDATDQNFWGELPENGSGGNGYRGARRAGDSSAALNGEGTGQWAGRTALRDRIQDGVRSRTSTNQRRGGRGGGDGGGWDDEDGLGGGEPGGRWQRFKRYVRSGKWWRHWTWKKVLGLIGGGIAGCVLLGALAIYIIYEKTPIPDAHQLTANWQSSQVYFPNGKLLGTFDQTVNGFNVDRTLLTENQIPKIMTDAMTAAEDRGFYTEGGISVTGLLRSAYDDVFGSGGLQGGSTITMQYAKNRYAGVNTGQNASTKLKEIFIAMKLAHQKSKQWIMTQYLNTVPFGTTIYGVGAAAQNYFGVNLARGDKLSYQQAAVLAAMPNSPGFLSPDPANKAGYAALQGRWRYVLTNMVRDGNITPQQAATAKFPAYNPPKTGNGETGYTGYLMDMVRQELEANYGYTRQQIDTKGLKITTTFSQSKTKALIKSVNAEKAQMRADGVSMPLYDRIGSVLENSKTGAIIAVYGGAGYYSKHCGKTNCFLNNAEIPEPVGSSFKPIVLATAVHELMNVFTSKLNGDIPIWVPVPQHRSTSRIAELMLSPTSQPPASFGTAPDRTSVYFHKFDNGESSGGPITVANAAANSSDPAFEDLAHADGIQGVIDMAGALGVGATPFQEPCFQYSVPEAEASMAGMLKKCNDLTGVFSLNSQFSPITSTADTAGSPDIALGEGQLTAIEQASIFATLANGGLYHSPHVIAKLSQNGVNVPLKIKTSQVLSEPQAADVDYALSFDNTYGTAACTVPFRNNGGVIAKTGTLGTGANSSQAWFVGATPEGFAMSVALYTNSPGKEVLNNLPGTGCLPGSQGGAWPASIWNNFFTSQWGGQSYQTVQQALPTVNGYPFQAWTRLKPKPKKLGFCKPGQTQHCKPVKCRPGFRFGQPCTGGNPAPTPTCSFPGQQNCTNPTPNPTQSCFPGTPCNGPSPSPTPTPSPTPSCSGPGPCTTPPAGGVAKTTAATRSVAAQTTALHTASLAKLERLVLIT